jgi:hypothetical protein
LKKKLIKSKSVGHETTQMPIFHLKKKLYKKSLLECIKEAAGFYKQNWKAMK